jgi:hypothetical protein
MTDISGCDAVPLKEFFLERKNAQQAVNGSRMRGKRPCATPTLEEHQ